jgi:hypothetical protein
MKKEEELSVCVAGCPGLKTKKTHNLGVGKTSFIVQLIHNHFDTDVEPTFQDDYQKTFYFDEIKILLRMYDTTGWEGN